MTSLEIKPVLGEKKLVEKKSLNKTYQWRGLYSPPGIPHGSARNGAESADPRTPIFWCIGASPFRADPCGSAQNDAESGPFSDGSVELTRTVPC